MNISRIEKDGKIQWQVALDDNEVTPILECLLTGIIGDRANDSYRMFAGVIMVAMLSKQADDIPEVREALSDIRKHHAPGQFIVDVTTIARHHAKGESPCT